MSDECIVRRARREEIKVCSYKKLPSFRPCGEPLMRRIVSGIGNNKVYPYSVYCCASLIASLQTFILRPGFVQMCESTRLASCSSTFHDVYDGAIWKEFCTYSGTDFLSAQNNYAFLLNVDWFQPFIHVTYSIGVLYMVVLNLPRSVRFKRENVLLLGVIPGPSEPSLNINSYLAPVVAELKSFWTGVSLRLPDGQTKVFRGALIGVACDLPAARKVCGFLGHNANLGCSKCLEEFSEGFSHQNFSNFNKQSWRMRYASTHRTDVTKVLRAKTKTEMAKLESKYGCRYSVLLDLPYFDPVRMLLIDPMHNLYLGTAKHFTLDILVRREMLSKNNIITIEQRLRRLQIPAGLGRIPTKINVGTFLTAEQWKNWTNYFSVYCLHNLIPTEQMECWRHFVLASRRLCKFHLTLDDLSISDALLLRFCKRMCQIYGANSLTPNIHLHLHLTSCVKDFGPFRSFWLFPFERYNGVLGNQPNNNRSVELQLMRRFQSDNLNIQMNDQVRNWPLRDCFEKLLPETTPSVADVTSQENVAIAGSKSTLSCLSPPVFLLVLRNLYSKLYPEHSTNFLNGDIFIASSYRKFSYITWNGHRVTSTHYSSSRNPYVLATPVFTFSTETNVPLQEYEGDDQLGKVIFFLTHSVTLPGHSDVKSHLFACLSWPMVHPERFSIGKPVEVWCKDLTETSNVNSIIPVSNISNIVIISVDVIPNNEHVLFSIPI